MTNFMLQSTSPQATTYRITRRSSWTATAAGPKRGASRARRGTAQGPSPYDARSRRRATIGLRLLTLYAFSSDNWQPTAARGERAVRLAVVLPEGRSGKLRERGIRPHGHRAQGPAARRAGRRDRSGGTRDGRPAATCTFASRSITRPARRSRARRGGCRRGPRPRATTSAGFWKRPTSIC